MFQAIRKTFVNLCTGRVKRSQSGEVISKAKIIHQSSQSLSIDSKRISSKKIQEQASKLLPEFEEFDFGNQQTVKKSSNVEIKRKVNEEAYASFVSEIGKTDESSDSMLLKQNDSETPLKQKIRIQTKAVQNYCEAFQQQSQRKVQQRYDDMSVGLSLNVSANYAPLQGSLSSMLPQRLTMDNQQLKNEKLNKTPLMKNKFKMLRMIRHECSICRESLRISDSLQLGCTHRYHKRCAIRMRKQDCKCSICERKSNTNNIFSVQHR